MKNLEQSINDKHEKLGENPRIYLKGLLLSKPLTYWDYIPLDTLLSLQKQRTDFADEKIFVIYHRITELMHELVLHELRQITYRLQTIKRFFRASFIGFGIPNVIK